MNSDKKRVLFICPAFFGYETDIKNAIVNNGYKVDFFDERTSNNSFYKAIFRVKKSLLNNAIDKYYRSILQKIRLTQYHYFLLIKGEIVPEWFITKFRELNPTAKLIYYTYDSFNNNNEHSVYILKHFDSCYSFDFEDVKLNPELKLKHLFYTADYLASAKSPTTKKYDMAFVGTLHSNRYSIVKSISLKLQNTFIFNFMPAKWYFFMNKLLKKEYRHIDISEVSFTKITKAQVAQIFRDSKSVLDIQRSGQTGLTMRTFEVLASGSILITTNAYVKQAEFYDEANIIILNDNNAADIIERIQQKISEVSANATPMPPGFDKYFINNWVNEFFA